MVEHGSVSECVHLPSVSVFAHRYSSAFLVFYVAGLPIFILFTLLRYRRQMSTTGRDEPSRTWVLAFLLEDYRLEGICFLWEAVEILRKLILSIIGSFFSANSPMAIAIALLLSVFFLILQHQHQPFADRICNLVQQMEMQVVVTRYCMRFSFARSVVSLFSLFRWLADKGCVVIAF